MPARFVNTIIFVSDIEKSKAFYSEVLGLKITRDLNTIVFFENHFVLHCSKSLLNTIYKEKPPERFAAHKAHNLLVYCECESGTELLSVYQKLKDKLNLIHGIEVQAWGQKVFRFYDPDGHIVEFGEPQN